MPFRINAKYFFLTYPNANFEHSLYYTWLESKHKTNKVIVCTERHQSGEPHMHVGIEFKNRTDVRDERHFDYSWFHPNIQKARNWAAVVNYVKKGGEYTCFGFDEEEEENLDLEQALDSMDRKSFLLYCIKQKIPYGYCNELWNLSHKDRGNTITEAPEGGRMVPRLEFTRMPDNLHKALVIMGPTGTGKTTWALRNSPKPALVVTHMDDLRHYDPEYHKSIIFDDMGFTHMPIEAQIHITDWHLKRSIHARYRVAEIPAETPKIFTSNRFPFTEDEAIKRRLYIINLEE
nr:Rep [Kummerowia striata CRESS virus]